MTAKVSWTNISTGETFFETIENAREAQDYMKYLHRVNDGALSDITLKFL